MSALATPVIIVECSPPPRVFALLIITSLASCSQDDEVVDRVQGKLTGPGVEVDPPSPVGSATLSLHTSAGNICSGTLITPSLILTAGHCTRPSTVAMWATKDGGTAGQESHNVDECFIHPKAQSGLTLVSCDDTSSTHSYDPNFDMAVLRVDSPFTTVSPRTFDPPKSCLADADGAPGMVRGFAHSSTRSRLRTTAFHRGYQIKLQMTSGAGTSDGDSGGTIEEAITGGGLLGNLSEEGPDLVMGFTTATGPFLWSTRINTGDITPQEFLWSVLDPAGNCALGDPDPCVAIDGTTFADTDGDGLPDVRDLCPANPVAGSGCDGQHCDADGDYVGDECDSFPGVCNHDDPDGDGMPSAVDPCPMLHASATSSSDIDGDGVPDSCDRCAGYDDTLVDWMTAPDADGDGVPDGCDNCPVPNPSQSNCSFDMELLTSSSVLGDACDSNPCTPFDPAPTQDIETVSSVEFALTNRHVDGTAFAVGSSVEGTLRTGHRWCPCDTQTDSVRARGVCALAPFDCFQDVPEYTDRDSAWKPMTIGWSGETTYEERITGGGAPIRYYEIVTGYAPPGTPIYCQPPGDPPPPLVECSRFAAGDWDFWTDGTAAGALVVDGLAERVRGVVWSRGVSYAPADDTMVPFGCNLSSCTTLHGNLNSHYWSGEVRWQRGFRLPSPDPGGFPGWAFLPQDVCPNCDDRFPLPHFIRDCAEGAPCLRFGRIFDPQTGGWHGVDLPVGAMADTLVGQALTDTTLSWVLPAEPAELLGDSATRIIAYQQSDRWIRLAAVSDGQRLVGYDRVQGFMDGISGVIGSRALLSGNRHVLIVVGGFENNEPIPHLRELDLATGARSTLPLTGASLGEVWAATLDPSATEALVLHALGGTFRLTSVDLRTGQSVDVVSDIEFTTAYWFHELAALPDGGYAMFAQSTLDASYELLTFGIEAQELIERRKASGNATSWGLRGSSRGLYLMEWDTPTPVPFENMQPAQSGDFHAMF